MNSKEIFLKDGISLYAMNTENRFKTNCISILLVDELKRDSVTQNSLIPLVLRRGCQKYPTMQDTAIKLEDMYGASFASSVYKMGNKHVIQFSMNTISNDYTLDKSDLFVDAVELMCDTLLNPIVENGAFKEEYVSQEKESLKEIINSKINDKGSYANERAIEEMYKDDPYGLYKFGYVEDLEQITSQSLYARYMELLKTSKIYIYVSGNIDEEEAVTLFSNSFMGVERNVKDVKLVEENSIAKIDDVIEHQSVTQGKIVLGYKLKDFDIVQDLYKMILYSAILGGTASSKLFNNVREKKSLAYTIRSQYIKQKGAIIVSAGIELKDYQYAKECIEKEINDMVIGNITGEELKDAKANLITGFRAFNDSQSSLISWAFGQKLIDANDDLDYAIGEIEKITVDEIVEVAKRLEQVIVYYLCD